MYSATGIVFRNPCRYTRAVRLSSLNHGQMRTVHYNLNNPVFVKKVRSIAGDCLSGENGQGGKRFHSALDQCTDLVINDGPPAGTPFLGTYKAARKELRQTLDADAQSNNPKFTEVEREAVIKPIDLGGFLLGGFRVLVILMIFGVANVLSWLVDEYRGGEEGVLQRQCEAEARWKELNKAFEVERELWRRRMDYYRKGQD